MKRMTKGDPGSHVFQRSEATVVAMATIPVNHQQELLIVLCVKRLGMRW